MFLLSNSLSTDPHSVLYKSHLPLLYLELSPTSLPQWETPLQWSLYLILILNSLSYCCLTSVTGYCFSLAVLTPSWNLLICSVVGWTYRLASNEGIKAKVVKSFPRFGYKKTVATILSSLPLLDHPFPLSLEKTTLLTESSTAESQKTLSQSH